MVQSTWESVEFPALVAMREAEERSESLTVAAGEATGRTAGFSGNPRP